LTSPSVHKEIIVGGNFLSFTLKREQQDNKEINSINEYL
jgi:hypothetical protein